MAEKHEGAILTLIDTAEALLKRAQAISDAGGAPGIIEVAVHLTEAATKALELAKSMAGTGAQGQHSAGQKVVATRLYGTTVG